MMYLLKFYLKASQTCIGQWVGHGKSCYYFSNATSSDKLRWKDVYQRCNDLASDAGVTANYLAIDSKDEKASFI